MTAPPAEAQFARVPDPLRSALAFVPLLVIRRAAAAAAAIVMRDHPQLFGRLGPHIAKRYAFVPTDLPFAFVLRPDASEAMIDVVAPDALPAADAVISGGVFVLLALLEGRLDGDAVFFSRDLAVTGDVAAVLALRNAVDAACIDLPRDLAAQAGPFARPLRAALERFRASVLAAEGGARWS